MITYRGGQKKEREKWTEIEEESSHFERTMRTVAHWHAVSITVVVAHAPSQLTHTVTSNASSRNLLGAGIACVSPKERERDIQERTRPFSFTSRESESSRRSESPSVLLGQRASRIPPEADYGTQHTRLGRRLSDLIPSGKLAREQFG